MLLLCLQQISLMFSFYLNFSVCSLLFTHCRIISPLASGVCFLVVEGGPQPFTVFLMVGTVACFWWVELSLVLLVWRPMTKVEFWDGCKLKKTLNSLSSDIWGSLPILLLFGLNKIPFPALDPIGCWVGLGIGAKMGTTERVHSTQHFLGPLLSASFSPVRYSWPSPIQETLQDP